MELLQIVPMLPPALSGVGDFAWLLARELQTDYSVRTRFLNADLAWRGNNEHVAPFAADVMDEHSAAALRRALERASSCQAVLLHYVAHGYEKRGCPFWLVRSLEQWKGEHRQCRLIVLFHEVSGSGPIWTSGFWTAGLQTSLARRLARLGDCLRVTTEIAAERLRRMLSVGSRPEIRALPVFSTLGEPAELPAYHERSRQMIVFGGTGWRREAYTRHLPALRNACRQLKIEVVIDVGVPVGLRPALDVPFVEAGVLPTAEASTLMRASTAGFFTYPALHLGKSTIFAAYCAHGMVPTTFSANQRPGDQGLQPGRHFLIADVQDRPEERQHAALATAARVWYQQHGLAVHAREIYDDLPSNGGRR